MEVINVSSADGGDFAAMEIEDDYGVEKAYEVAKKNGGSAKIELESGDTALVKILEFGDVDPQFVEFVREMQDYDITKAENFFVINK